jgi:two-component sensor histidine kinase
MTNSNADHRAGDDAQPELLRAVEAELRETRARLDETARLLEATKCQVHAGRLREASLEGELQHRVRNLLAVVRSIFSRTAETQEAAEDLADHFRGRLDALARYHAVSLSSRRRQFDLEEMVRDEFLQVGRDDEATVDISGPEVTLGERDALALGLALHELVTNSIKFGVLSPDASKGRLRTEWRQASGTLIFKWHESGITVLGSAPLRRGFGREYIEQLLPYQHDGKTSFEFGPGTLACVIELPLGRSDLDP